MRIGIDISQTVFEGTGVANYTKSLVENLLKIDKKNTYVLFGASLRKRKLLNCYLARLLKRFDNVSGRIYPFPPTFLEFLWNKLHIFPIEWFIGPVDVFLSSDWTQPPTIKAKKVTTVHDLTPWKFPQEAHPRIVAVHKRRMKWVKKECDLIICDSQSTKEDVKEIFGIEEKRLRVVYLGCYKVLTG